MLLDYILTIEEVPFEVVEAVTKAFPAAVTMKSRDGMIPLHRAARQVRCDRTLRIFKFFLEFCKKPSLDSLASTIPLPSEIIEEHVMEYLDLENPLLVCDKEGANALHAMFGGYDDLSADGSDGNRFFSHSRQATEALQELLKAAPGIAKAQAGKHRLTALHLAVSNLASISQLRLLVEAFPDALTTNLYYEGTPLWSYLEAVCFYKRGYSFQILKLLAQTRPRAVLMPCKYQYYGNGEGHLPCHHGNDLDFPVDHQAWLCRLTKKQQNVPLTPEEIASGFFAVSDSDDDSDSDDSSDSDDDSDLDDESI